MTAWQSWTRRRVLISGTASLAAAALGGAGHAQPPRGRWRDGVALPYRVQEIYPAAHAGGIHLAGGFAALAEGALAPTRRHVRLEPGADEWRELAGLPSARHHATLVGAGTRLLALGGFTAGPDGSWIMTRGTWRYDADADAWAERPSAPEPHAETVCALLGGRVHVVGGRTPSGASNASWDDHVDTDRHFVYDPDAERWDHAAPAPTARNSAAGAVIDGLLYVVGGRTVAGGNVADTHVYDAAEDRWRTAAPMPQAQGGLAAAAAGGRLFAFGGEFFGDGGGVYAEAWQYDPDADRWSSVAPMPTPRHGLGAAALEGAIHVIGGATRAGGSGTSATVEIFEP